MNQKQIIFIVLAATILIGGALWCAKKEKANEVLMKQTSINSSEQVGIDNDNEVGLYENPTIGLAFEYPKDWKVNEQEFANREGDGMNVFSINITPPNWNSIEQANIAISHYPYRSQDGKSFDNIPLNEQLALIDCPEAKKYNSYEAEGYICEIRKSSSGVVYIWETGYINQKFKGYSSKAVVPTGKYIVTFDIRNEKKENFQEDSKIFERVVSSIELR